MGILICKDRQDWLRQRLRFTTGSKAANLFGCGFGSAIGDYLEATAAPEDLPTFETPKTDEMLYGKHVEDSHVNMIVEKYAAEVLRWNQCHLSVHESVPLATTPDNTCIWPNEGAALLETKTAAAFSKWEEVPIPYQIQVQAQMATTGYQKAIICVLRDRRLSFHVVDRNDAFITELLFRVKYFWQCVANGVMPDIDGSKYTERLVKRLHPDDNGKCVQLEERFDSVVERWLKIKRVASRLDEMRRQAECELRVALGENTYGETPNGHAIKCATEPRKGFVKEVAPSKPRVLRYMRKGIDHNVERIGDDRTEDSGIRIAATEGGINGLLKSHTETPAREE